MTRQFLTPKFRILAVCLFLSSFALTAVELPLRNGQGEPDEMPWQGPEAVREQVDQIMERQKGRAGVAPRIELHPHNRTDRMLRPNPDSPDTPIFPVPDPGEPGPIVPNTPQTTGINFLGATLFDTLAFPPDSMGTVGPAQFIVAVNGRIRTFDKTTGIADGVIDADTDVFFNSVMTAPTSDNFTSDPRIRYDRLSRRWFIIIIDVPGSQGTLPNRVLLAVSDGPIISPGTVWRFFQFQHDLVSPSGDTGKFADYPTLGVDANALYIGVNVFNTSGLGTFYNTTAFVVRKSSVLTNGPIVVTAFRKLQSGSGTGLYTPQGVDNYDPAATEGYFIGVDGQFYGRLNIRRVSNPGGTPTISGNVQFTVPATGPTLGVPHLGNTGGANGNLDGLDYRLLAAHIRNGRLWATANIAVNSSGTTSGADRMAVRWYELTGIATGQTPSVVQSGTVFDSSAGARCFWMGTVMVSGQGHAAVGFSSAGANDRINAATVGRLKNDTLGTMRSPELYTASSTAYNPPGDPGGGAGRRWGDYSYTSLDPNDDMTMWTIQEFCNTTDSYGVQVVRLLAPGPAIPSNCVPSTVLAGTTTNVTLIGKSDGDTGFFDPGNGFSNRIAAAVGGAGVTLNNITFNNSTNLTLNLSISPAASPGTRTVTVTNPDGQSAASLSGILNIVPTGSTNVAPVLANIPSRTNTELATLTFTNTATDANGDALTWSLDPGAPTNATIHPVTGLFSWTPTEAQGPGVSSVTVRVTDNGSPPLSDTMTFSITVLESNSPPSLSFISDRTINEVAALTFTNIATDSDLPANTLAFSFASPAPPGATLSSNSGVFSWTPTEAQGPGTNQISIRVSDNGSPSLSATQTFTVFVLETNSPPVLTAISDRTIVEGETLSFTNTATDPDLPANTLNFSFASTPLPGATLSSNSGVFSWTPTEAQGPGTNQISIRVSDNGSPSLSATQTFTVFVLETNSPPVLTAISDRTIVEGQTLTFTNTATDPDLPANTLTFSFASTPLAGATLDSSSGVFSWTPDEAQGPATNQILIAVSDNGSPSLSTTQAFTVFVLETNSPPLLVAIPAQTILEGQTLLITNSATDPDLPANTLTYSLDTNSAPVGAQINPTNGIFGWTPSEAQGPGTNFITVVVTDDGSPFMSATQTFTVVVQESNSPPVLAAIADRALHAGTTLLITNTATDPDLPPQTLTFSLDPGAPPTSSIDPQSGVFSWSPDATYAPSTNSITVRVSDDAMLPQSDTKSFNVTVVGAPVIQSVTVSNSVATVTWSALSGQTYTLQFKNDLNDAAWSDIVPDITATNSTAIADDTPGSAAQRFYRVLVK